MKYLSVCAGIEAATVAWHPLGWEAVAYSEIEKFPSAVLAHHYPNVPNVGDMTKFKEWNLDQPIDLLVGGTPCQSFSVAGLRKGLEDPRGNLALVYCGILDHFRPQWFVWENVPGVLSSNGGRDFGSFLGALAELGYGFAYRVLDAQYFGVAQRRRRVFVVGYLGDWRPAAEVLFERESVRGDSAPSREKRQEAASRTPNSVASGKPTFGTLSANAGTKLWLGNQEALSGDYHILQPIIAKCLITKTRLDSETETLIPTYAIQGSMIGRSDTAGPQGDGINEEVCFTQNTTDRHAIAQPIVAAFKGGQGSGAGSIGYSEHIAPTLSSSEGGNRTPTVFISQPIAYSFDSLASNSMKSSNPHSGGKFVDIAKTLDTTTPDPSKNQGGIAVMHPITFSGQMSVPQTDVDMSATLQAKNPMAVAQPIAFTQNTRDEVRYINGDGAIAGALAAQSGMKQTNYIAQPMYMGNAEGGAKEVPFLTCHNLGGTAGISNQTPLIGQPIGLDEEQNAMIDAFGTLKARTSGGGFEGSVMQTNMAVRRLTPVECERLQGFPDNYTNIPWRKAEESPDGPRYKALGNSMAVPVMAWIGKRIADYEQQIN